MTTEKLQTEQDVANLPNMTAQHVELYERIQAFSLDQPDAQLPFSKRLARDNGWSLEYAQQVIEEYKKFAFLAVVADHPVTPSDQVDQAWHLHLSYTRSYWEEFCPQVLQTPLHHGPTLGGQAENEKFDDWYRQTLDSYAAFFNQAPPSDIWPAPEVRFGRDLHFVRVNTQQNWVISRRQTQQRLITGLLLLLVFVPVGLFVMTFAVLWTRYSTHASHRFSPWIPTIVIYLAFFGGLQIFRQVIKFIKSPSRSRVRGGWTGLGYSDSGCGVSCGSDWGWSDFGGYDSSADCGDGGGGDSGDGGGCGGGGCGGCGGCGGGGD